MYHSLSGQDDPGRHPYFQTNTRPDIFARHMQFLADNNYEVISLSDAVSLISSVPKPEARSPNPEASRNVVITFDDGFRDFHDTAWPILKKHGFAATMFLPTGFIGEERNALNGKDCLTWAEVRKLAAEGAAFGAHTVSHVQLYELYKNSPDLSFQRKQESTTADLSFLRRQESTQKNLSFLRRQESIEHELLVSKQMIEEKLGMPVEHYSYAYAFPEQDRAFVSLYEASLRAAGYRAAVSTRIGTAGQGDNPYTLKRLPVNSHDDETLLRAKLEGGYDWLYGLQAVKKKLNFAA